MDVIRFSDDDRKILLDASKKLEVEDPYIAGRLAELSGRVAVGYDPGIEEDFKAAIKSLKDS